MFWSFNITAVFALSVLLAGVMIPQILLISFRKKLFDVPDERKIHTSAVPRLGGIAFIPVIFICIAMSLAISLTLGHTELLDALINNAVTIAYCFCALFILYIVGMADDLIGVRYRAKFVVQIVCGVMLICGGLAVSNFHGVLLIYAVPKLVAWGFTVLLTVFIINALNLIDGIDGLASALSSVAIITYGIVFALAGEYLYAMVAAAALGVLVPFFYYNVFGNPQKHKKIFMGDTGSLSIGLIISILSFKILALPGLKDFRSINMLIVAMSPLVIPCFDVVRVYFYRLRHGQNPFMPDKNHIHHKLLALGMSQRVAMLTIVGCSVAFTAVNIQLSQWINVSFIILIDALIFTVGMMIIKPLSKRLRR